MDFLDCLYWPIALGSAKLMRLVNLWNLGKRGWRRKLLQKKKSETSRTLSLGGVLVREVELLPWKRVPQFSDGVSFTQDYTSLGTCSHVSAWTLLWGSFPEDSCPAAITWWPGWTWQWIPFSPKSWLSTRRREYCSGVCWGSCYCAKPWLGQIPLRQLCVCIAPELAVPGIHSWVKVKWFKPQNILLSYGHLLNDLYL